jgi:hypothetical protein
MKHQGINPLLVIYINYKNKAAKQESISHEIKEETKKIKDITQNCLAIAAQGCVSSGGAGIKIYL